MSSKWKKRNLAKFDFHMKCDKCKQYKRTLLIKNIITKMLGQECQECFDKGQIKVTTYGFDFEDIDE